MFERSWRVLVPMCSLASAKSRLAPMGDQARRDLALAMLLDTLAAAAQTPVELHVVTTDLCVMRAIAATDIDVHFHRCRGRGLNHDLRLAALRLPPGPAAVLLGDLPALRPQSLADALAPARRYRSAVVADACGSGTTLLTFRDRQMLRPAFGPGSLRRHRAAGAALVRADDFLRQDVDEPADVLRVHKLGVGRHTAAVIRRIDGLRRAGARTPIASKSVSRDAR